MPRSSQSISVYQQIFKLENLLNLRGRGEGSGVAHDKLTSPREEY